MAGQPVPEDAARDSGSGPATFTASELPGLCDALAARDRDLRRIVDTFGYPPFWSRPNTFESVVWFILEQQVSLASARAALEKLRALVGTISPEAVLDLTDDELRAASFSRQKAGYVRGLAAAMTDGGLDLRSLEAVSDADVQKNVDRRSRASGNWTVDVYLIMVLHRRTCSRAVTWQPSTGSSTSRAWPGPRRRTRFPALAERWAPLRTVATMLVWHDYLARRSPPSS